MFWLNGLAGTGKSTIAQTFAEITFAEGKLGASFFCSWDFEDRSNIQAIFPTLAFQLAYRYPQFREQLLRVLRANPGIGRESLCSQMEKVIVGPLKAIRAPTLIIIDALDECKDKELGIRHSLCPLPLRGRDPQRQVLHHRSPGTSDPHWIPTRVAPTHHRSSFARVGKVVTIEDVAFITYVGFLRSRYILRVRFQALLQYLYTDEIEFTDTQVFKVQC